jgi:hypothetical protein
MKNIELLVLQEQDWRFCRIDYAKKGPTYSNWQNSPYLLQSIPATGNVGVLTGRSSNGLLAIDFDGAWAWEYWQANVPYSLQELNTVVWSSGRTARAQMAFKAPQEAWPLLHTFKVNGPEDADGKKQQLEFRWDGVQSVLPPSMHPDTHKPYEWVSSPLEVEVQELPIEVLEWMFNYSPVVVHPDIEIAEVTIEDLTIDKLNECETVLKKIKQHEPVLGYDDWIRVTWATVSHIGTEAGIILMRSLWEEKQSGEYKKLMRGYNLQASPKFGSLVHRAAQHNAPKQPKRILSNAFRPQQNELKNLFQG